MLTDADLETLLRDMESDRVERKAGLGDRDKIRQAICAFANDLPDHQAPGVVFVGVTDDGKRSNLAIDDQLLQHLAHMRGDGQILPLPSMVVGKRGLSVGEIAVIMVEPSDSTPVRYEGRVWIRVGPRRAIASAEEERRLAEKRRGTDLPFDQQPVRGATLKDLDLNLFQQEYLPSAVAPETLRGNGRSLEEQLASLHFLTLNGIPNYAAILSLGADPLQWIPGAYVQFLRLDGLELAEPIRNQKELSGPLPQLLRQIDELLDANVSTASDVARGATEVRHPDYPIAALRQLSRNAVLHRTYEVTNAPSRIYWYDDRIEIQSPGGPYGRVGIDNFGQPGITDYRNPLLAEAMKTLGFVQRFGLGIPLAQSELRKNGNPDLEFEVTPTDVLAIVRRRS